MPIYAYRCASCGFEKDALQKISDAPLTQCPSCGADAFRKQVTAAGFQLKGSGWYVTDFRGGNNAGKNAPASGANSGEAGEPAASGDSKPAGESAAASSTAAPAAAAPASPAAGSTGSTGTTSAT